MFMMFAIVLEILLNRSECLLRQPPRTIDVIECVACLLLRRMPTSHLKKNVCRLKKKYTVSCPTSHLKKKHADSVADSTTRQRLSGSLAYFPPTQKMSEAVSARSVGGYSEESLLPSSSLRGHATPIILLSIPIRHIIFFAACRNQKTLRFC